ncbi:MAG: hypothetical protein CVT88_05285 [Candidatus Altiarchaeales archaeon HGW-Altiarchaeales-1]|nr:MAG: hypothetical protein CVT88_05285 [Candidatus Altiarchaeales archaeon HGW-Altiarchaeales-1]
MDEIIVLTLPLYAIAIIGTFILNSANSLDERAIKKKKGYTNLKPLKNLVGIFSIISVMLVIAFYILLSFFASTQTGNTISSLGEHIARISLIFLLLALFFILRSYYLTRQHIEIKIKIKD